MYLKVLDAEFAVKRALNKVFREENGDVNIISTVILIGIAVVLAGVFKDKIKPLVEQMLDTITTKAKAQIQ
ncbi:Flp1 family type IVb pilin [Butyrivibrio sp. FC2001]|uniref:Flp1 family type IVb pilin n=1 Tax=Butyrivibrio sp. FC2001 TaxID=1280671 RepID=UPI0003FA6B5F|nr:Flp1 family type IVb pilin [Butyrivibrio sp. FC2001]